MYIVNHQEETLILYSSKIIFPQNASFSFYRMSVGISRNVTVLRHFHCLKCHPLFPPCVILCCHQMIFQKCNFKGGFLPEPPRTEPSLLSYSLCSRALLTSAAASASSLGPLSAHCCLHLFLCCASSRALACALVFSLKNPSAPLLPSARTVLACFEIQLRHYISCGACLERLP